VIGVEQRHITTESLQALYAGNPEHAATFAARQGDIEDSGVSITYSPPQPAWSTCVSTVSTRIRTTTTSATTRRAVYRIVG
jgi:hypothetical protein